MTRTSINHAKHILKNYSFGNITVSIDEYLNNADKWGVRGKGLPVIASILRRIRTEGADDDRLNNIRLNDSSVYRQLQNCDTVGVVNLECSGIQELLRAMQPDCFEDIEALCTIFRPTPLTDGSADLLIARKQGTEPIIFIHPKLKPILKDTYGVIIYREQLTGIAEKLADFNYSDSEKLLRVLYGDNPKELPDSQQRFILGCKRNGIPEETAQAIFAQMESASRHCFTHPLATGQALTAYLCAWLKVNYPEEFKATWDAEKPAWDERNPIVKRSSGKVNISKFLSLVLRHRPSVVGLKLDEAGWVLIAELIEKGSKAGVKLTTDKISQVVATSDKQRFAISEDGLRIRANQGHSLPVDLDLKLVVPPELLYHGTASHNLVAIRQQGIIKGNRQYVHLSRDIETAEAVGKRYGKPAILSVQADRMHQAGFSFYLSANGVWLTDHVPKEYILIHKKPKIE